MGPRKFLHHGLVRKSKSGKELVAFLLNDFLLLTVANKTIGPGHQFSFEKNSDVKLKLYRKVTLSIPLPSRTTKIWSDMVGSEIFFKDGTFPAFVMIQTVDLWYRKPPLFQLTHHCQHSSELAYLLLTQQHWVQFPAFPKHFQ